MIPSSKQIYTRRKEICIKLYEICLQPNDEFKLQNFMQIWPLLRELIDTEKSIPFCCLKERNEKCFENLTKNIGNSQISENISIERVDDQHGFGIKSKKPFHEGDLIFQIPSDQILSISSLNDFKPRIKLASLLNSDKMLTLMPNVSLAVLLLFIRLELNFGEEANDKNKACNDIDFKFSSKYKGYLDTLPNEFHTPLFFDLEEILMLKNSQCFGSVINHIKNIVRQYAYIFNLLDSKQKEFKILFSSFSYKNYCWAVSCVSTRQNKILDKNSMQPVLALIPLIEMCNHHEKEPSICIDYDVNSQNAICYAQRSVEVNEKLTMFYGRRTNQELLIHNGFVSSENNFDVYELKLGMSSRDPLYEKRTLVLKEFGLKPLETFKVNEGFFDCSHDVFKCFLFVKVFIAKTGLELDEILKHRYDDENSLGLFIEELKKDLKVSDFLRIRLEIVLKGFEKLMEDDVFVGSVNKIFISRLIRSEFNLISGFKKALERT